MAYTTIILYIIALALVAYKAVSVKDTKELLLFMALLVASWLLFNYEGYSAITTTLLSGFIIFNAITSFYGKAWGSALLLLAAYYLFATWGISTGIVLQSAVIGALSTTRMYSKSKHRKAEAKVENMRNIFQIAAGIFFILLFIFVQQQYASILLLLVFMAGVAISNYTMSSKNGGVFDVLSRMEREGFDFGHGAFWLGVGALFAAAFLNANMVLVVFSAIFFGDSFSTILGVHYGHVKLPYNKKKSVIGTASYFAIVLLMSFPILSYLALPVAALAALVESLPIPLDDNFDVSLVLSIILQLFLV